MTYHRDYISERVELVKLCLGDSLDNFDESEIVNNVKLYSESLLHNLEVPFTVYSNGNGNCNVKIRGEHIGSCILHDLPNWRLTFDSLLFDYNTVSSATNVFRDKYVNKNIAYGMKLGKFLRDVEELKKTGEELGFNLELIR